MHMARHAGKRCSSVAFSNSGGVPGNLRSYRLPFPIATHKSTNHFRNCLKKYVSVPSWIMSSPSAHFSTFSFRSPSGPLQWMMLSS